MADEILAVDTDGESPEEVSEIDEQAAEYDRLYDQLRARAEVAKLEVRRRTYVGDDTVYVSIGLPSGREKRWVNATGSRLPRLLEIPFEKYVVLKGYEAICCYADGMIEIGVGTLLTLRHLSNAMGGHGDEEEIIVAPPADLTGKPTLRIRPASAAYTALTQGFGRRVTLTLEGIMIRTQEEAIATLQKYANSLLFQIDLLYGIPLTLDRERVRRSRPRRRRVAGQIVQYPNTEYDNAPLSLYWYARSATGMPLLKYLAFYQCIEFYFPTFGKAEARRKIGLLLKDPTFRADRDSDVARLVSAIAGNKGGGFGDERGQLRATLNECLSAEEIRSFFESDEDRIAFFSAKQKVGVHKVPLANSDSDLRNDVADRIYNIRCRIVHTKNGEQHGEEMILPFSEEADILVFDIELIQFVATKVLVATSSSLT